MDLEAGVFDSRLNSCIMKSRRDLPPLFLQECCKVSLTCASRRYSSSATSMRLRHHHQLLLQTVVSNWALEHLLASRPGRSRCRTGFPAYARGFATPKADAFQALFNPALSARPLRFARDDKVISVPVSAAKISAAIASRSCSLAPP